MREQIFEQKDGNKAVSDKDQPKASPQKNMGLVLGGVHQQKSCTVRFGAEYNENPAARGWMVDGYDSRTDDHLESGWLIRKVQKFRAQ